MEFWRARADSDGRGSRWRRGWSLVVLSYDRHELDYGTKRKQLNFHKGNTFIHTTDLGYNNYTEVLQRAVDNIFKHNRDESSHNGSLPISISQKRVCIIL